MRYARGHNDDDRRDARHPSGSRARSSRSGSSRSYDSRRARPAYDDYEDFDEFNERPARSRRSSQSSRPSRSTRPVPDRRSSRNSRDDHERRDSRRSESRRRPASARAAEPSRESSRRYRDERPARNAQGRSARRSVASQRHVDRPAPHPADFDPFEPQTPDPRQRRARGYDQLDEMNRTPSRYSQGMRPSDAAPALSASHYARSSERYSRSTPARGSQRAQGRPSSSTRADEAPRGASTQRGGRNANAERYSRDRYLKQPGQGRATSVSQQSYESMRRESPVNSNLALIIAAVAAFLLVILVVRFIAFSGTAAEYGSVKDEIRQETAQTEELDAQNTDLQSEIDSMQELIDQYNKQKR